MIYREVFGCYPDDEMRSFADVPEARDSAEQRIEESRVKLNEIKGHLVEFPLRFLENEDLRFKVVNKEYYLPDSTFT